MKISIAMASYNGEKYINDQVMSIINQTYKPDEIIIVDDFSKDDTKIIIKKIIKREKNIDIKLYENPQNLGVVATFKKAIEKATGDIIFLCDQDDIWDSNKIEEMIKPFINDKNLMAVVSGYNIINEKNELEKDKIYPLKKSGYVNFKLLVKNNIFPGCSMAFRKEIKNFIKKMDKERFFIHDWYLILVSLTKGDVFYINKPYLKYRIHTNNTIGKNIKMKKRFSLSERILSIEKKLNFYVNFKKEIEISKKNQKYLSKNIVFSKKRLDVLKKGNILILLLFILLNFTKYGSFRDILGDIIYVIKK